MTVLVFAGSGALLIAAGRKDRRAVYWGVFFLLNASAVSQPLPLPRGMIALRSLPVDAFWPYFFWLFVGDFPETFPRLKFGRVQRWMTRLSAVAGIVVFVANAVKIVPVRSAALSRFTILFDRSPQSYYWGVIFGLAVPLLPFAFWKAGYANLAERRRVYLFVTSIVLGTVPLILVVLVEFMFPGTIHPVITPIRFRIAGLTAYAFMLSIPVTTGYAVVVHRVLDVRLIVRKGLQYAFARYSLLLVTVFPLAALFYYAFSRRQDPLVAVVAQAPPGLVAAVAAGFLGLQFRQKLLQSLDKRFFRQQYDAQEVLAPLIEQSRTVESPEALVQLLETQIGVALQIERIEILLTDRSKSQLLSLRDAVRPLELAGGLVSAAAGSGGCLRVEANRDGSMRHTLSTEDEEWISDGAFDLLVPLLGSDGAVLGLICLGQKRSELLFSGEERQLLSAIASSAAATLEGRNWSLTVTESANEHAMECLECKTLHDPASRLCPACGDNLIPAGVPYVLLAKFRFDRRLGAGGMGVVYRAIDLNLATTVAIKTLPKRSPSEAVRLRREARLIAMLRHPNLLEIRSFETWHGVPMLVFEYLSGGTVEDRLKSSSMGLKEVIEVGMVLCDVLEYIHSHEVFHLDIKPGNIGYAGKTLKLLDFGVAHMKWQSLSGEVPGKVHHDPHSRSTGPESAGSPLLAGTPAYWPPELLRGSARGEARDLWAAALVLYECLTGRNPMRRNFLKTAPNALWTERIPGIEVSASGCSQAVSTFFSQALSRSPKDRPGTARAMRHRLNELQETVRP